MNSSDILTFFNIFIVFLLYKVKKPESIKITSIVVVVIIVLLLSMRRLDGLDTLTYISLFESYTVDLSSVFNNELSWKGDYLFFFIGWASKQVFPDSRIYFFILAFLNMIILNFSYLKFVAASGPGRYKELILFNYLLFCASSTYFLIANTIRQGLGISFSILALGYLFI